MMRKVGDTDEAARKPHMPEKNLTHPHDTLIPNVHLMWND